MEKKIAIPGFIHAAMPESWDFSRANVVDGVKYDFWVSENMGSKFSMVCPYVMTFEIPEKFDAVDCFVESLKDQKRELMADHQKKITDIDRQIQQLLAITNEAGK